MKIAATYENGTIFQHFGRCPQFKIYVIENGEIISSEVVDTNGSGHGLLAGFLAGHRVEALICGGIGMGAQQALASSGIRLYAGQSGSADECAEALAKGTLKACAAATCNHHHDHDHHHEGGCGDHGCGSHSCGNH